jgi:hypothetical protein
MLPGDVQEGVNRAAGRFGHMLQLFASPDISVEGFEEFRAGESVGLSDHRRRAESWRNGGADGSRIRPLCF